MKHTPQTISAAVTVWDDEHSKLVERVLWIDDDPPHYAVFGGIDRVRGEVIESVVRVRKVQAFLDQHIVIVNPREGFDATMAASLAKTLA